MTQTHAPILPPGQRRRMMVSCGVAAVLVAGSLVSARFAGLRFNQTPSMPRGIWQVAHVAGALGRGQFVTVCPPDTKAVRLGAERGYVPQGGCPGGYEPLVKPIVAVQGDLVEIAPSGVRVNGHQIDGSAQLEQDTAGRALRAYPAGAYQVEAGEVWLLSGHDPRSFDSRYFGPVAVDNVQGTARPVWVVP